MSEAVTPTPPSSKPSLFRSRALEHWAGTRPFGAALNGARRWERWAYPLCVLVLLAIAVLLWGVEVPSSDGGANERLIDVMFSSRRS